MVDVNTQNKTISVNVSSSGVSSNVNASGDTTLYYSNKAREWATSNRIVDGVDYSSKYYAGKANESALNAQSFAQSAQGSYNNFQQSVNSALNTVNDTVQGAITTIDTKSGEVIENIDIEANKQIANIERTGFYMRDDKLYFINSEGEEQEFKSGGGTLQMFDTVLKDHILTFEESRGLALQGTYVYKEAIAGERYGYPDFYTKCLEEYNQSTDIETVNGKTVKVHSNGHKFYDIADKTGIDDFFNTMGSAWFYGIDTENERIFLPRNKWFVQITDDGLEVGKSVEAGLPNITGSGNVCANSNESGNNWSGALSAKQSGKQGSDGDSQTTTFFYLDASRSNPIYGNSDTVQPNAVKKLLYICVGNTQNQKAVTDVTEITTSENDTLPWGYHFYSGELLEAPVGYIKSEGQWNYGTDWKSFYARAVNKIGEQFAGGYIRRHTETYTDYDLVVNEDDITFRLPLLSGGEKLTGTAQENWELTASGKEFEIEKNGTLMFQGQSSATNQYVSLQVMNPNRATVKTSRIVSSGASQHIAVEVDVERGQILYVTYSVGTVSVFRFTPSVGNGSLYFKCANAVQNLELLDVGRVEEKLVDVVHKDLLADRQTVVGWLAPDTDNGITITSYSSASNQFTVPASGWIEAVLYAPNNTSVELYINNKPLASASGSNATIAVRQQVPVFKGDTIYITSTAFPSYFYPMKGAK